MTHQVQFPNLGISVEVNPIAFQVGNFTIYWYGIIIGIGFLLAVLYGFSSCKKMNINKDHLLDAIIAGLLGGIIGARLYYVIFYPGDKYITNPMEIFNIKEGGLGIYGGIIGGMLCGGIVGEGLAYAWQRTWLKIAGTCGLLGAAITFHATYNLLIVYGGAAQYVAYVLPVLLMAAGKLSALRLTRRE